MLINVLYQDEFIIAVEKPSGIFVHPYDEYSQGAIHLMKMVKNQTGKYLYPIHRLDRPVSGIVIFGLNPKIVKKVKEHWNSDLHIKEYLALTSRKMHSAGEINFPLKKEDGTLQFARTLYWPVWTNDEYSLLKVQIRTGRRHQIRRHLAHRWHPILGDTGYGKTEINNLFREKYGLPRIFLHAHYMKIFNPIQNSFLEVSSPLPPDLSEVLTKLQVPKIEGISLTTGELTN